MPLARKVLSTRKMLFWLESVIDIVFLLRQTQQPLVIWAQKIQ